MFYWKIEAFIFLSLILNILMSFFQYHSKLHNLGQNFTKNIILLSIKGSLQSSCLVNSRFHLEIRPLIL